MKLRMTVLVLAASVALGWSSQVKAAAWPADEESHCSANRGNSDGMVSYAETRDQRLASANENIIEPGANGSIRVHAWANADVEVKACIQTSAASDSEAKALAQQVTVADGPGRIAAHGPAGHGHSWWSVSYEVWLPASASLKMEASNGGISVEGVAGRIQFVTLNGGVKLRDIGGEVNGETTNGSITVGVISAGWHGSGLHVRTTNGSVHLNLPENFSANVEASTVNGSLRTDFPVTVSGEMRKSMSFAIGSGGPTVEARTVNGSVQISHGT